VKRYFRRPAASGAPQASLGLPLCRQLLSKPEWCERFTAMRNNEASASTMSFVTSPVFLGIYMCGVCACCVSFVVIMVWVCWTLVDTYQRGVTEIGCAEQFGIWWFLIGMYLVAIAMTCGRGCADAGTTVALQFSNAELQTIVMWKGFMLLLAYLMQLVFMVVFIAWGTWMWQNMPPRCTARYERDFPDLLLLFHVYVIMLWIGAVVFILGKWCALVVHDGTCAAGVEPNIRRCQRLTRFSAHQSRLSSFWLCTSA
jgi:hypothetical protein